MIFDSDPATIGNVLFSCDSYRFNEHYILIGMKDQGHLIFIIIRKTDDVDEETNVHTRYTIYEGHQYNFMSNISC